MKDIFKNHPLILPVWLIVIFLVFVALYLGKSILVTLIFTMILLFIFSGMYSFFYRFSKRNWLAVILTAAIFLLFFWGVGYIISSEVENFSNDIGKIGQWFEQLIAKVNYKWYGLSQIDFKSMIQNFDFWKLWKNTLWMITSIVWGIVTVWFLLMFLIVEKNTFTKKMRDILPDREEKTFFKIGKRIYDDLNTFFLSKFFIAMFNGVVSLIIMKFFGLEYALMFALFVFLLDFIPAIGWIIALGLPFLYSFVQFDTPLNSVIMLACLIIPQTLSGNYLEPKIMGNRLNLSGFVIMVSLIFWSSIWGIAGAFLAVPLMASINIVLAQFKATKPIAKLLSKEGEI